VIELEEVYSFSHGPSIRSVYITKSSIASLSNETSGSLNEAVAKLGPITRLTTTAGKEIFVLGTASQVRERINNGGKRLLNG